MYLQRNNITLSRNAYTSSANLTACYYFTQTWHFYRILFCYKPHLSLHVKFPIFRFSRQILLKISNINITKIRPVGVELIYVDRQTDSGDMTKLIGAFREKTCVIPRDPACPSHRMVSTFVSSLRIQHMNTLII